MWTYPSIDPVVFSLGPLQVHWYGLMYLAGFSLFYFYGSLKAKQPRYAPYWGGERVSDFLFYGALGVILGGRLGYILFYDFAQYVQDPLAIFKVWQGGMSFHGGLLGVTLAMFWFAHKTQQSVFKVADFVAPMVPFGLFFGRIGNFINGELWGKVASDANSFFAMKVYDPVYHNTLVKYPTQLLEALLEGVLLFIILALYARKPRPDGSVAGLFLVGYGVFRFIVEFWRVPDSQLGYLALGWLTMGQLLSLPMVLIGAGLMAWAYRKAKHALGEEHAK